MTTTCLNFTKKCGGCPLLAMPYREQLAQKQARLQELLGGFAPVKAVQGMADPLHYRNKAIASFAAQHGKLVCGLYAEGTHKVLPGADCLLQEDIWLIPFELADQHDILYGRASVTRDIPTADIEMRHAMSLVRIKILKNEYMGEGIVSNIRFDNVITRMTLDIRRETNSPLIFDFSSRGSLQAGGNYHLNDADPVVVETILPPVYGYDQKVTVSFTIDGKEYSYEFHRDHEWEAGMKYTYTLKMTGNYNSPVNMEQVDIDVEYWSRYGKTDQIILNPNPEDYEFTIWQCTVH